MVEYTDKNAAIAAAMSHFKLYKKTVYVERFPNAYGFPGNDIWMVRHHKPKSNYTPIDGSAVDKFGHLYGWEDKPVNLTDVLNGVSEGRKMLANRSAA